jgi:hypothetical protein
MGLLIVKSDFVGKFELAKSINDKIDSYIAKYEENYLRDLLGSELFTLFKNDVIDNEPQSEEYLTIFNPINININDVEVRSEGLKDMLLGFIYFDYERDNRYKTSNIGQTKNNPDSGSNEFDLFHLNSRYNDSIKTYQNIQYYICANKSIYPTYKGLEKSYTYL